ncbi:TPA: hypothetical protein R4104_003072 [Enterobacter asburiae]|uniref:hypothetical protein n=1 Tax=Enterobacter asburiae TaxID=61645 RepID=UPI000796FCBA|nr:hypothetical protein [Enterobacter asburiae]SAG31376.1 Uncharacterised protein [Enterobacter cloacae]MDL4611633.1 hypothetical protein [Enterobacter asburiae]HCM9129454.1 hypothetical protein [Enterobacter asburiae]HDW1999386.1 hypothetical protein [Enterobacter asburiae]HED1591384.1 hypothetical protein [Enterobacter asburiae]
MNNFRVIATCIDVSGAPLPVTWYGNAVSSSDAKLQMTHEAQRNGWSIGAIICVQQRKISKSIEVLA